jgi:hypothetical protein
MSDSANHRINNLWERAAIGLLMILLGVVQTQYWADKNESKQEIKELNTKVLELYRTSVTKTELKELETRLTNNNEAIRADVRQILTFYLDKK